MFKKIYIEILNYCNLNCQFCNKTNKPKREMTFDEFKHILKEIKPYTKYIYLHVQGEPFLHKNIDKFIYEAYNQGFNVNLTTNATLLNNHIDIIKYVRQINISLQAIIDLEKQNDYLNSIIELINRNYDTYISLRLWGNFNKNTYIPYFEKAFNKNINLNESNKLKDHVFFSFEEEFEWPSLNHEFVSDTGTCLGTKTHIAILCDGTVIPCCLDKDGIIDLGNIYKDSLSSIICGKRFKEINKGFNNNLICDNLCKRCTYRLKFDKKI